MRLVHAFFSPFAAVLERLLTPVNDVTDQFARVAISDFATLNKLANEVFDLLLGQSHRADSGHQDSPQPAQ
ncbi:MAG: hypothetical protein IPH95_00105 [Candidatus Promineofilum sp.]|nr:hypothetical protein [Promineifilum sp.]